MAVWLLLYERTGKQVYWWLLVPGILLTRNCLFNNIKGQKVKDEKLPFSSCIVKGALVVYIVLACQSYVL